ncbi:MAG: metallophosphoesterase [Phycisphaerae bacterium]|nr:metallophosphoesterase [Phycisphaerae bacterium]
MLAKKRISLVRIFGLALLATVLLGLVDAAFAFRFGTMCDSRGSPVNVAVLSQLITDMNAHDPAFCLFPGDLVAGFTSDAEEMERQLGIWIDATSHFTGTMYVTPGNHDIINYGNSATWRKMFPDMPQNGPDQPDSLFNEKGLTYYFDHGNSRFISITSDHELIPSGWVDCSWPNDILSESTGFEHVFVATHHPCSDLGGASGDYWQTLVSHGVDAAFCGHHHKYSHSQPSGPDTTWDVIVGTAGAPLWGGQKYGYLIVDVIGPYVEARFYADLDHDGNYDDVADSFVITVPEPGTMALLTLGAVGVLRKRRR